MNLIDLIEQARQRQEQREAYWRACQEAQQRQERERKIGDLKASLGYNFGATIESDLGLRYEWSERDDMPIACFDHVGQAYTIGLHSNVWYVGRPDQLRCYGDAGGSNNRDIELHHQQERYDRLLLIIGAAIGAIGPDDDLPF